MERAEPCTENTMQQTPREEPPAARPPARATHATSNEANASIRRSKKKLGAELNRWASSDASKIKRPRHQAIEACVRGDRQDSASASARTRASVRCGAPGFGRGCWRAGHSVVKACRHGRGTGIVGGWWHDAGGGERGEGREQRARVTQPALEIPRPRTELPPPHPSIHPSHTTTAATRKRSKK
jgi:hypothetical protein